jgi:hypothetical protein
MSTDFEKVSEIARQSLMPDFFAVRIEEEGLFEQMKLMIAKLRFPTPLPALDRIREIAAAAATPIEFVDGVKAQNLWSTMRDILSKVKVK